MAQNLIWLLAANCFVHLQASKQQQQKRTESLTQSSSMSVGCVCVPALQQNKNHSRSTFIIVENANWCVLLCGGSNFFNDLSFHWIFDSSFGTLYRLSNGSINNDKTVAYFRNLHTGVIREFLRFFGSISDFNVRKKFLNFRISLPKPKRTKWS